MKKLSRRQFLARGAIASAMASAPMMAEAAWLRPTLRSSRRAVVVGSGFGGSVATLRLAEAGIPTMLIERGKHWKYTGESSYPTLGSALSHLDDEMLWREPSGLLPGSVGMLQQYLDDSMPVGVGAGLGGGSLVYGGVLLQPRREVFEQALPMLSWHSMANTYYPRVLSRISGGPIPDDILASPNYTSMRVFIDNARRAGLDVVRSEVGFNWNIIREEIEGKRTPFASVGEYVFGCNSGAKNTLDRNYLKDASDTGNVEIRTLHNVVRICRPRWQDHYEVHCEVLNERGAVVANHIIECQHLFMAAGSVHTTRLLLKAKAVGDVRNLGDGIGEEWGGNGDELMGRRGTTQSTGPIQGGPPSIAAFDLENPYKPTGFMHSPSSVNQEFTQLQMGMCIPDETSRATYSRLTDTIKFNWSRDANDLSHQALLHTMEKMISVSGGEIVDVGALGTWHPLGGVAMGVACNESGAVYGAPGLFVVDGAAIPGSSGAANPSLTIAANAERMMELIIPQL